VLSPDVTAILESAVADTRARRHHELTLEHLLLAIVKRPAGTQILRACKVDLDAVQVELERHLGNRPGTQPVEELAQSQEFQRTLQRAASHVQSAGRTELTTGNLLVATLEEHDAYGTFLLVRAGLTRISLVTHVCHGAGEDVRPAKLPQARLLGRWRPQQQATSPNLYSVVFHDDEYTTREFVVELLTSVFEQSPAHAAAVMESAQQRGIGMVGTYSLQDATAILERATQRAREAEFPLKLTLVPTTVATKR